MEATLRPRTALTVPAVPAAPLQSPAAAPPPQALSASASAGAWVRSPSLPQELSHAHVAHFSGTMRCGSPRSASVISSGSSTSSVRSVVDHTKSLSPSVASRRPSGWGPPSYTYHLNRFAVSAVPPPMSTGACRTPPFGCEGATVSACLTPPARRPSTVTSCPSSPHQTQTSGLGTSCFQRASYPTVGSLRDEGSCLGSPRFQTVSRQSSASSTCHALGPALLHLPAKQDPVASARSASPRQSSILPPMVDVVGPPVFPSGVASSRHVGAVVAGESYMPSSMRARTPRGGKGCGTRYETKMRHDNGSPNPGGTSPWLLMRQAQPDVAARGDKCDNGLSLSQVGPTCRSTPALITEHESCSGTPLLQLDIQPSLAIVAHAFRSDLDDSNQLPVRPGDVIEKLRADPSGWTYGRILESALSDLSQTEAAMLPCGWFPESCLVPEGATLPLAVRKMLPEPSSSPEVPTLQLSVDSRIQTEAQQGCGSGASTTADINSNSLNSSDASKEAAMPWSSPGGSVSSSVGQAAKRRQKPRESLSRRRGGYDEVTAQAPITVEEAEHRVEMASCLQNFLDAQEKMLMADMAVQAGCQRQSSMTRLRLLRAKKAAAGQALREAQARARVCRSGLAVTSVNSPGSIAADVQQVAQRRHRQMTEHLLQQRANKRAQYAAELAAAQPPPAAGAQTENWPRGNSRGITRFRAAQPNVYGGSPRCAASCHTNAETADPGTNDGRRGPRAVPQRTNLGAAIRSASPPQASPSTCSPRSTHSMGASSSASNIQAVSTPNFAASSSRGGTSSHRPSANSIMSMKLPRSLRKLLVSRDGSTSHSVSPTPSRQDSKASLSSALEMPESGPSLEAAIPGEPASESEERIFVETFTDPEQLRASEEELRQVRELEDALEESARAVGASERRVARLQKAWEEAVAADDCSGISLDEVQNVACETSVHLRLSSDGEHAHQTPPEDLHLDEHAEEIHLQQDSARERNYNEALQEHVYLAEAQEADATARLFVDVLQMAQEIPARWQDMSDEERSQLINGFSRMRGLLLPHRRQE